MVHRKLGSAVQGLIGISLLAGLAHSPAARAQGFVVTPILDERTPRPDGAGNFYPVTPALDGGVIVFNQGDWCAACPAPDSIWAAEVAGGVLRKLVGTSTAVPGGAGNFSKFELRPIVKNGIVLFIGFDRNSRPGLYTVPAAGGAVARIADTNTAIPGASVSFTGFDRAGFHHDGSIAI